MKSNEDVKAAGHAYREFAPLYDLFMDDGPHDAWVSWLKQKWPQMTGWHVADLGCGTGRLGVALSKMGSYVVGVDASEDMLAEAAMRSMENRASVQWLCQDIQSVRLPRPVQLCLSTCDVVNYLLTLEDVHLFMEHAHASTVDDGWLCFDSLGPRRMQCLQNGVWHDIRDEQVAVYETSVNHQSRISYDVHLFSRVDRELWRRDDEYHEQQYYSPEVLQKALEDTSWKVEQVLGDFGRQPVDNADRICFIARRT